MRDFEQVDPSVASEEAMLLFLLGLVLGVLSIRMKHQQQTEQLVEVTKDFKTFQATFMSKHHVFTVVFWAENLYIQLVHRTRTSACDPQTAERF